MSRSREISTDISKDEVVALLILEHGPLVGMLYAWALPHADDWGRLPGKAMEFALLVTPALLSKVKEIDEALDQIAAAGLWRRYTVGNQHVIAFPRESWFKRQNYINAEKRTYDGSKFPAPPDEEWLPWEDRPSNNRKPKTESKAASVPAVVPATLPARIPAESQSLPEKAKNPQEKPENPASPSPTPSPSLSEKLSCAHETSPVSNPEAPALPAPPVRNKSSGSRPETRKDRQAFIDTALEENPHWREALTKKLADAAPDDWSRYGAKIIREWIDNPDDAPIPTPAHLTAKAQAPAVSRYREFK